MCIVYFTLLLLSVGWTESASITRTLSLGFGGENAMKMDMMNPLKGFSDFISGMTEPVGRVFHSFTQNDHNDTAIENPNNDTAVENPNNQTTTETIVPKKLKPTIDYSNRMPVVEETIKKVKAFALCVVNDRYNCGKELGEIDIMKHLGPPPNDTNLQKTVNIFKNHVTTTEKVNTTTIVSKTITIGKKTNEDQETTTGKDFTTTDAAVTTTEDITTEQPTEQPTTVTSMPATHRIKTKVHQTTEKSSHTTTRTKSSKKASTKKVTSTSTTTSPNSPVLKSGYQRKQGGLGLYPADYLNLMEDEPTETTTHQKHIKYKDIANDNSSNLEPEYDPTVTSESTKTTREVKEEDALEDSFFGNQPLFTMEDIDTEKSLLQEKSITPEEMSDKENVTEAGKEKKSASPEETSDKETNPEETPSTPSNEENSDKENTTTTPEENSTTTDNGQTSDKESTTTTPEEKSTTPDNSESSKKEDDKDISTIEDIPPIPDMGDIFSNETSDTVTKDKKPNDIDSSDKKKSSQEDSSKSDNTTKDSSQTSDKDTNESDSDEISKDIFGDSSDSHDIMEASSSDRVISVTEKGVDKKLPVNEPKSTPNKTTTFFVYSIPIEATSTEISVVTEVSVKKNHHDIKTKDETEPKLTPQFKNNSQPIHKEDKEHVAH